MERLNIILIIKSNRFLIRFISQGRIRPLSRPLWLMFGPALIRSRFSQRRAAIVASTLHLGSNLLLHGFPMVAIDIVSLLGVPFHVHVLLPGAMVRSGALLLLGGALEPNRGVGPVGDPDRLQIMIRAHGNRLLLR